MQTRYKLGVHGKLALTFAVVRNKTRLIDCYQVPPLKASRTLYLEGEEKAIVYLVETSGGLVEGDKNEYVLIVNEGAKACVIPQSATKIYPSIHNQSSKQEINITLENNTFLEWNREELIPFQQAKFEARTIVRMESSSTFLFSEIIYPGREKRGEIYQYTSVSTHLEVWMGEDCIVYDPLKLTPAQMSLSAIGVLEGQYYIGSIWIIAPSVYWEEEELKQLLPPELDGHLIGLTMLKGNAILIRWLTRNLPRMKREMETIFNQVREKV